ncbi:unnamed protein product [Closterium sp. NIES-64]|nr:unnamed protein product [Closterium sp. NIES-64]
MHELFKKLVSATSARLHARLPLLLFPLLAITDLLAIQRELQAVPLRSLNKERVQTLVTDSFPSYLFCNPTQTRAPPCSPPPTTHASHHGQQERVQTLVFNWVSGTAVPCSGPSSTSLFVSTRRLFPVSPHTRLPTHASPHTRVSPTGASADAGV